MRPISIELQAFGPFAGTERVDFENISKDGLFLIRGRTGSGKSMILDAICFALFGKSSGENRDNLEELRCNRCDSDIDTFVEFTFEEKGIVYMFERTLKKGRKNFNSRAGAYIVKDNGLLKPIFENPKEREVTKKAEEIIGLTFNQFRQVIILPQGKFEKLLTSGSDDKEKLLASIFGTEKWQVMADRYYDRAKAEKDRLNEIKSRIDGRLEDEDCADADEFRKKLQSLIDKKNEEEKLFNEHGYDREEEALVRQKELHGEFITLKKHIRRKEELDRRSEEIEEKRKKLEAADKAEPFRNPIDEKEKAFRSMKVRKADIDEAEESKSRAEERVEKTRTNLEMLMKKQEEYETWKRNYDDFEQKRPVYESLAGVSENIAETERKYLEATDKLSAMKKKHEYNVKETERLYREYDEEVSKHKSALDSYMRGIRGLIADELEEGKPCPVCGSIDHPVKAEIPEGTMTKEIVDLLDEAATRKKENLANANLERISSEKKLDEINKEWAQLKADYDLAAADFNRISGDLIEGIGSLGELDIALKRLKSDMNVYEYDRKQCEEAAQNAVLMLNSAETRCANAANEIKRAEEQYLNANKACEKLISDSEFESVEEIEEAMLAPEERSRINSETAEYDGQLLEIRKIIEDKEAKLEGIEEPDISLVTARTEQISMAKEEYNRAQGAFIKEIGRMKEKADALEKELEVFESEIQKAEADFIFAKSLRGDTGIGLQRYVLGIMFSSVIAAANEMLEKVHGGRYRLYRTDDKIAGSNKKGLGLKVHDSYSDSKEGRTVSTLSGGEKFLASLALSLGMSAVARSGGINIETIFIDEGFGTLDENSVDDALDVLKSIRQMNGSVGIISHMDVLGANIPSQLLVVKEKETSTIVPV